MEAVFWTIGQHRYTEWGGEEEEVRRQCKVRGILNRVLIKGEVSEIQN